MCLTIEDFVENRSLPGHWINIELRNADRGARMIDIF